MSRTESRRMAFELLYSLEVQKARYSRAKRTNRVLYRK